MFHMIRYGSYTWILHKYQNTDADAGRAPYVKTKEIALHRSVTSLLINPAQTPPTSACMEARAPFRHALLSINL